MKKPRMQCTQGQVRWKGHRYTDDPEFNDRITLEIGSEITKLAVRIFPSFPHP